MRSFFGLFRLAIANLKINKLRSGLTVLGMVFGTGAVIATLSSSEGASQFIQAELKKLGVNTMTVRAGGWAAPVLDETDAQLLKKYSKYFEVVNLVRDAGSAELRYGSRLINASMVGVQPAYFAATKQVVTRGRIFDDKENSYETPVVVLSAQTDRDLFGGDISLGKWVHLYVGQSVYSVRVVGVLKEKGGQAGSGLDNALFLPLKFANKIAGSKDPQFLLLATLFDEETSSKAKRQIQAILKSRFPSGVDVSDAREAIERNKAIWEKQNLVGICLALISLLTGGVGIMNIMLLSVSQRRKEIGLRKAVGANDFHIMFQFLLEAVIVCVLGGILGICAGMWFGQKVASFMGQWDAQISLQTVGMAIGFAMLTGVLFGLFPAMRASKLDPYEALRA